MGLVPTFLVAFLLICGAVSAQPAAEPEKAVAAIQELVVKAVAKAEKSVVSISRVTKNPAANGFRVPIIDQGLTDALPTDPDFMPGDFGAGVVIDREGRVVTSYNVIGNPADSEFYVWSQHKPFRAQVLAADPWFDLAVLKVAVLNVAGADLEPIVLGDGKAVAKGQFVIALGNPQALARDGGASASWGLISNLLRRAPRVPDRPGDGTRRDSGRETVHQYGTLIQTDAKWDVGYRGGPLLNLAGEMVGLLTAYSSAPEKPELAGLAIPVDEHFRTVLGRLTAGKTPEFGFLGVGPKALEVELRQRGYHGTLVETVLAGSPAARAGLRAGDIITHADAQPLHDDDDLFRIIGSLPPEHKVKLTVARGSLTRGAGESLQLDAKLEKKRVLGRRPPYSTAPTLTWRGLQIDYASVVMQDELQQAAQHLPPDGCLYVTDVERDSGSWKSGVRAGMFLTHVGARRVFTPQDFFAAVAGETGEVRLQLMTTNGTAVPQTVSP